MYNSELKHHNRRIPAFADDANGGFDRSAENLSTVKAILTEFAQMCGLETNVDKTTLMPIGCLGEPVGRDVVELGFEIVDEIKCLGLVINNRASNLSAHFDGIIRKIRQLVGSWERYNLSLMGRICVAKTMLISQIGYIGCIVTPTLDQLRTMQSLIDGYVTRGIVIANDRLYRRPNEGGLGLIDLTQYITALQCSWIKRCYTSVNDPWRWRVAEACDFYLEDLKLPSLDPRLYPIEYNIVNSFIVFRQKIFCMNENFLHARLVDNPMNFRSNPGRRGAATGILDRNFFGPDFFEEHKERLLKLNMNNLVLDGRVVQYNNLLFSTGIPFTQATYLRLVTAGSFAMQKYAGKEKSNGESQSLDNFMRRVKQGSKKFRKVLENTGTDFQPGNLRVAQTFFRLIMADIPEASEIGKLHAIWTWQFLSNRIRFFSFQFYNNSLGTKCRIAAR